MSSNIAATKKAAKMIKLHQKGAISDNTLMMFGISGELPEQLVYEKLTRDEKQKFWEKRLEDNFGSQWKRHINKLPALFREIESPDWLKEGF